MQQDAQKPLYEDKKFAQTVSPWKLNKKKLLESRAYYAMDGSTLGALQVGRFLPSQKIITQDAKSSSQYFLKTTRIFTDLPRQFLAEFLKIQNSPHPFKFESKQQITVRQYIQNHSEFTKGKLKEENWRALGWQSQRNYAKWLDEMVLTAFVGTAHSCIAPRVFDNDPNNPDNFRQILSAEQLADSKTQEDQLKTTHIVGVAGLEYRWFTPDLKTFEASLPVATQKSEITLRQILKIAEVHDKKHIVLTPYGMGVFLNQHTEENKNKIRSHIFKGMNNALAAYSGPDVVIHYCGSKQWFHQLVNTNPKIKLQHWEDKDAYSLTNRLQDAGESSLITNAGNLDWMVLRSKDRIPGNCYQSHTLFHSPGDEYLGLVTATGICSVQNLMRRHPNIENFIVSSYESPEQTLSQQDENEEKGKKGEEKKAETEKQESMQIPDPQNDLATKSGTTSHFLKYWQEVPGVYRIAIFPVLMASASAIMISAVGVENIFTQTPLDLIAPLNHLLLTAGTVAFSTTFVLHFMHIAIQVPENHGEYTFFQQLGLKWQSLNPWERFLTAAAITLSVLAIFSACYFPEFGICKDFFPELTPTHWIAGTTTIATLASTAHVYRIYHSQPAVKTTLSHHPASDGENSSLHK